MMATSWGFNISFHLVLDALIIDGDLLDNLPAQGTSRGAATGTPMGLQLLYRCLSSASVMSSAKRSGVDVVDEGPHLILVAR